uniref:Putative er lumen protein retaining receptor n=1 Tax=Rhipicephalus microplus TaxID=6941 RepID=A0A6G5A7T5_RHIMP
MNIFRLAGDLSHLLAIIILLLKIWRTRSCSGISGKSQILFSITYTARYLDLFTTFVSPYNSVMKVVFLAASYGTLYLMYVKFKATNDRNHDTFRIEFLLVPVCLLALLINHEFTPLETQPGGHERGFRSGVLHATLLFRDPLEVLWTFSISWRRWPSSSAVPGLRSGRGRAHHLPLLSAWALPSLYLLNWSTATYTETSTT